MAFVERQTVRHQSTREKWQLSVSPPSAPSSPSPPPTDLQMSSSIIVLTVVSLSPLLLLALMWNLSLSFSLPLLYIFDSLVYWTSLWCWTFRCCTNCRITSTGYQCVHYATRVRADSRTDDNRLSRRRSHRWCCSPLFALCRTHVKKFGVDFSSFFQLISSCGDAVFLLLFKLLANERVRRRFVCSDDLICWTTNANDNRQRTHAAGGWTLSKEHLYRCFDGNVHLQFFFSMQQNTSF